MTGSARFDRTRRYRYHLRREWQPSPRRVTFIMLNPSTAGARVLDPTIRRCIGFARTWGFGGIDVVNLFAWRATDPRMLQRTADPVGPRNDAAIEAALRQSTLAVAAWGCGRIGSARGSAIHRLAAGLRKPLFCLGTTLGGHPRHPLYVSGATPLVRFSPRAQSSLRPAAVGHRD